MTLKMEMLGWVGTALVIVAYVPQIRHLYVEKCAWGISIFDVANLAGCRRTASELLRISKRHLVHIRPGHQHHGHYGDHHSRPQEYSDLSLPLRDGFGSAR